MYNEKQAIKETYQSENNTRPDFGVIMDKLRGEAVNVFDNTEAVIELANRIKPIDFGPIDNKPEPLQEPKCIVEHLMFEIDRIRKSNIRLRETVSHLAKIVGN